MHNMNKRALIEDLLSRGNLLDRYENLECVNFNPGTGERRGVLSLVFKAEDILCDRAVAVKFMDPDRISDEYRLDCFNREPEILKKLEGQRRCLKIVGDISRYDLIRDIPGMPPVKLPCSFFVLDWLDQDIDHYFKCQQDYEAYEKLVLFNKILLAVEAVHERHVHHRDLKPDNMKSYSNEEGDSIVVIIDFGTAAHSESKSIKARDDYERPVGAPYFASPEAKMGFAGERNLGCANDIYSLGCMLYELFNPQLILYEQMKPDYKDAVTAINIDMSNCKSVEEKYKKWREIVPRFRHVLQPPSIDGPYSTLPGSIKGIVSRLFSSMIEFDFNQRASDLVKIRHMVNTALKILLNSKASERDLERRRCLRLNRQAKAQRNELRALKHEQKMGDDRC